MKVKTPSQSHKLISPADLGIIATVSDLYTIVDVFNRLDIALIAIVDDYCEHHWPKTIRIEPTSILELKGSVDERFKRDYYCLYLEITPIEGDIIKIKIPELTELHWDNYCEHAYTFTHFFAALQPSEKPKYKYTLKQLYEFLEPVLKIKSSDE